MNDLVRSYFVNRRLGFKPYEAMLHALMETNLD